MIYRTDDGRYAISSGGTWLPGSYESERAAKYAFRFTVDDTQALQDKKNATDGSPISFEDLKAYALSKRSRPR